MSSMGYPSFTLDYPGPGYDWRWRRAAELTDGDRPAGANADADTLTQRAVRYRLSHCAPDLADIGTAVAVHSAGGVRRRALQAYLLTRLPDDEVATRTGLTPAAVAAYAGLFFDVRSKDRHSRELRTEARTFDDPLVRAARYGGAKRVEARVQQEAQTLAREHERLQSSERDDLLDEFFGHDPAEYALARARVLALEEWIRRARGGA